MEELSLDNIFTAEEANSLFADDTQETPPEEQEKSPEPEDKKDDKETTEVNPNQLFDQGQPESVGSGDNKDKEDTDSDKGSTSPNFYSSIAKALTEEGIFPDLDDNTIADVKTPEDFRDLIEQQIQANLDERYRRIDAALNAGVEPTDIHKYEGAISYLDQISEEDIQDESENGETLRKNLIYQDFINRGYSKERAEKEVQKSLKGGTDLDDARDALQSNKDYYRDQYNTLIKEAQEQEKAIRQAKMDRMEDLKNSILSEDKIFGDVEVDKNTRQRVLENTLRPSFRDPQTGQLLTAIQKYERENSKDFLKYVGYLFTVTDGFKNIDNLVKGKVRKEVKKGIKDLESTINGTVRTSDGNLKFTSGVDDSESWLKEYSIDV